MADNKYCNLVPTNLVSAEYQKINDGFASVESDMNAATNRVEEILATPVGGVTAQEIIDARGGETVLGNRLNNIEAEKATKAEVKALASGSPKGVYADLATLIAADPDHDAIYITSDDGSWCYYNGATFVAGGVYQTTAIADASVTLDKHDETELMLNWVKSDISTTLPLVGTGNYELELTTVGNIFKSSGNLIDIVGMADGEYTDSGLTITILGNLVTISGTLSAARYFWLSTDTKFASVNTGLNSRAWPLPIAAAYTIGLYDMTYAVAPAGSISIRSTIIDGNKATINLGATTLYSQMTDLTGIGEIYLYLPATVYDCSFKIFLMPCAYSAGLRIAPDTVTLSNVKKVRTAVDGYALSVTAGTSTELSNVFDNLNTTKSVYVRNADKIFVQSYNTYFYYYIKGSDPESNKWLRYKFVYYASAETNVDSWNQRAVDAVENNNGVWTVLYPVVSEGEWEMAVKINGSVDFIGGRNHGSEINTYVKFYVDGNLWTPGNSQFWCKEIKIIEKSNMFDPADEVTQVATHIKDYLITTAGIRLKQRINWIADLTMDYSYMAMFPMARGDDTVTAFQITEYAYNDDTFEIIDVSEGSHSAATRVLPPNKWTLYSDSTGISGEVENTFTPRLAESNSFIQNTANDYNKVYFSFCGSPYSVTTGDVWESETMYRLNISI